jgi:protein-tyrosine phosphatase
VTLGLEGAPNTRDLGGLAAADGRRVAPGRLFRASALGRLTDADVELLRKLDLRTVIDLRHASEIAFAPPDRLPAPPPDVVPVPIYDPDHPVFTYVSAVLLGEDGDEYGALAEEGTPGAMAAIYRWFVHGEPARAQFGRVLRTLAGDHQLPALVHCSAGKDRTGWVTALVLTILGTPRDVIEADYLATNAASADVNAAIVRAMRERRPDLDDEAVLPVFEARPDYLAAAYAEIERVYGTVDHYLRDGLGLSDEVLANLRTQLLE